MDDQIFLKDNAGVRLDPANPKNRFIRPKRSLVIGGVVKAVIRKYPKSPKSKVQLISGRTAIREERNMAKVERFVALDQEYITQGSGALF